MQAKLGGARGTPTAALTGDTVLFLGVSSGGWAVRQRLDVQNPLAVGHVVGSMFTFYSGGT